MLYGICTDLSLKNFLNSTKKHLKKTLFLFIKGKGVCRLVLDSRGA